MPTNESVNLSSDGNETVHPSTDINNPANWDFAEPDDDQANLDNQNAGIETETDEVENDQESGDPENHGDESEADEEGQEPTDEAKLDETVVTLKGGEQVPVKELKLGYMRDRDYRVKTQDVANKSKSLDTLSTRVADTAQAIAHFLANQLPPEPPMALAIQNPNEYTRQKAMYDSAMMQVSNVLGMAGEAKQAGMEMTKQQRDELLQQEDAMLTEAFPEVAEREGREVFFDNAFSTARELGFSDAELQGVTDHRMFKLAHYARLGMQAERDKAKALKKVSNAPAPVPRGKAQGQNTNARKNREAMQRLAKSGSIHDAMMIDFE